MGDAMAQEVVPLALQRALRIRFGHLARNSGDRKVTVSMALRVECRASPDR